MAYYFKINIDGYVNIGTMQNFSELNAQNTPYSTMDTPDKDYTAYLSTYRNTKSAQLQERLEIFTKNLIKKYGSIDKIKKDGWSAIETQNDIDIIEQIIKVKSFVIIPMHKNDTITHFYTIGMWYYWSLPEIIIKFDKPVNGTDVMFKSHMIINLIHQKMFDLYKNRIVEKSDVCNTPTISRVNYENEAKNLVLDISKFDLKIELERLDNNEYLDTNITHMLWFYTFYMDIGISAKDKMPIMFPVYITETNNKTLSQNCDNITNNILRDTINNVRDEYDRHKGKLINNDLSDESDSE
jgi:hypothetical protein